MHRGSSSVAVQGGFTYVMVMIVLALIGIGLARLGPMWADDEQREREKDLQRVGSEYARAIAAYYQSTPGSIKRFPPDLQSLLLDGRVPGVRRYLRRLAPDPMAPLRPWGLIQASDGGIMGVYSLDGRSPLRRVPVDLGVLTLPVADRYSEWKFVPTIAK